MSRPLPIPPPDRYQIEALNRGFTLGLDTLGAPGWRGLGPPACLDMMIWSTRRMVSTASMASSKAKLLVL